MRKAYYRGVCFRYAVVHLVHLARDHITLPTTRECEGHTQCYRSIPAESDEAHSTLQGCPLLDHSVLNAVDIAQKHLHGIIENVATWQPIDNDTRLFWRYSWYHLHLLDKCINLISGKLRWGCALRYMVYYWLTSRGQHVEGRLLYYTTTNSLNSVDMDACFFISWRIIPSHASQNCTKWRVCCEVYQAKEGVWNTIRQQWEHCLT